MTLAANAKRDYYTDGGKATVHCFILHWLQMDSVYMEN